VIIREMIMIVVGDRVNNINRKKSTNYRNRNIYYSSKDTNYTNKNMHYSNNCTTPAPLSPNFSHNYPHSDNRTTAYYNTSST